MGWYGGRPRAMYVSSLPIIFLAVFILFVILGLATGVVSKTLDSRGFGYMIGTAVVSVPMAWVVRKIYYRLRKRSK
jgi:uncharacterized membrane protein (DUF485 family)